MATIAADLEIDEFKFVIDADAVPAEQYLALLSGLNAAIGDLTDGNCALHVLGVRSGSIITWLRIVAKSIDFEPSGKRVAQAAIVATAITAFQFGGQIIDNLKNTSSRTQFAAAVDELMAKTDASKVVIETNDGTFTYSRAEHESRERPIARPARSQGEGYVISSIGEAMQSPRAMSISDTGSIRSIDDKLIFESAKGYSLPIQSIGEGIAVTHDVPCRIRARTVEAGGLHVFGIDIL